MTKKVVCIIMVTGWMAKVQGRETMQNGTQFSCDVILIFCPITAERKYHPHQQHDLHHVFYRARTSGTWRSSNNSCAKAKSARDDRRSSRMGTPASMCKWDSVSHGTRIFVGSRRCNAPLVQHVDASLTVTSLGRIIPYYAGMILIEAINVAV